MHKIVGSTVRLALVLPLIAAVSASCDWFDGHDHRPLRYAGMGASDAVGIGAWPLSRGYVYQLHERLEQAEGTVDFRNLGIAGGHVDDIERFALPTAERFRPDVVTLWTGSNDLIGGDDPEAFRAGLHRVLTRLEAMGTRVALADLVDLTQLPAFVENPDRDVTTLRVSLFNRAIHSEADEHEAVVLVALNETDLSDVAEYVAGDGFHPNNDGHDLLAEIFWQTLAPLAGAAE